MAKRGTEKREDEVTEALPVVTALSMVRTREGWRMLTFKIQGDKVLDVSATEPDLRAIALEEFRKTAAKEFME